MCTHATHADTRNPHLESAVYAGRTAEFVSKMARNSVAIIVSNPEHTRSNDTQFQYRQSSDVLYVNGFPEADSAIVLTNIGGKAKLILFVRPKDRAQEVWTGIRVGVDGAKKQYLANEAYTFDKFAAVVGKLLERADSVYYKFGHNEQFDKQFISVWQEDQKTLFNPETVLHEMRLFKSEAELAIMRRAAEISAEAHVLAARRLTPGLKEYQIRATMEGHFLECGASGPAYGSIVASGNNAVILHYTSNRDTIQDGDLVLIDAACEYEGYAADITRTFPANGKFTEAQREIYQLVLDAQEAGIRMAKTGKTLFQVHGATSKVLRRGLVKLGIIAPEMGTRKGAIRAMKAARARGDGSEKNLVTLGSFFMHGTSHWMGLDVHDVGKGKRNRSGKDRKMQPGMVFTVEPGIYIDKDDTRVPEKYRGIGVRIEDDVVITADGCEVLTTGVPKTIDAIEQLMSEAAAQR
ncbi:MAG: M24 family metallopeptidase [Candidatus Melainabacteria bacterium]|nr:MAG: M24 family metallopeptidase [Candidatus Melainabacteria bacterium]